IGLYHERQLNKAREEIKKALKWIVDNYGGAFRVYKSKIVVGEFADGIRGMWTPPSYGKKYSIDFFRAADREYYYEPEEYNRHGDWNASHGGRSSAMEAAREIIAQWGGKVDESVSFERGEDPKTALNIGRNRKVKAGDQIEVYYRGKKHVVTAVTDEVEIKGKVCVRSGGMGGYREPEYESRIIKSVFIKDKEGNHFQADATESWDNEGNTIFPWKIEEYHELVLEAIDFERGKDPKDALEIGSPLARLADELGMTYAEIKQDKKDLHEIVAAAVDPGNDEDKDYRFAFYAVADDPMAYDIPRDSRLFDVALWADAHQDDAIRILRTPDRVSES
nr:hypothetical protein [Candidatus Paceibacterota bacterium]